MMTKTILQFTRPWGRYNKGDVAGFDAAQARRLRGSHAEDYAGPAAPPEVAGTEAFEARTAELAAREAQLAAREQALADALAARDAAGAGTNAPAAEKGAPPAQGKAK